MAPRERQAAHTHFLYSMLAACALSGPAARPAALPASVMQPIATYPHAPLPVPLCLCYVCMYVRVHRAHLSALGSWLLGPHPHARPPTPNPNRGSLLYFLGCSLDPPTFASAIKCHQKSTSNSAGSSVGSLAPPRATPRLGGVYVSCQYFPCSFVLALRELGLRLGVKAQLPLRASSRGVLPGAGELAG